MSENKNNENIQNNQNEELQKRQEQQRREANSSAQDQQLASFNKATEQVFTVKTVQSQNQSSNHAITQAIGSYTYSGTRTEENDLYTTKQRLNNAMMYTDMILGTSEARAQGKLYDKAISDRGFLPFMHKNYINDGARESLGLTGQAQQTYQNMLGAGFTGVGTNANGTQMSMNLSDSSFSKAEMNMLKTHGNFTRTIDGTTYTFTSSKYSVEEIKRAASSAHREHESAEKLTHARTTNEKINALNNMRAEGLEALKNQGLDIGDGSVRSLKKLKDSLDDKIKIAKDAGNMALVAKLTAQKNDVKAQISLKDKTPTGSGRKAGLKAVSQKMLGNDMAQGVQFVGNAGKIAKASAKVAQTSAKIATRAVVGTGSAAIGLTGKMLKNDRLKSFSKKEKDFRERRREGKKRERSLKKSNDKDGLKKFKKRQSDDRRIRRDANFAKRQDRRRKNGKNKKADRKEARRNLRKDARTRLSNAKSKFTGFKKRLKDSRIAKAFKAPFKILKLPINAAQWAIDKLKAFVKKFIVKLLIIPAGAVVALCVIPVLVLNFLAAALNFISEGTDLWGALNKTNYMQVIVDDVCTEMGKQFLEAARNDASTHYSTQEKIPSEGYDWYKGPNDGALRSIYTSEKKELGHSLTSINDNVLPIASLMHFRYYDEINYLSWYTAKAYVYYFYVKTHDVVGYDYVDAPSCEDFALYSGEIAWDAASRKLTHPAYYPDTCTCSNIYLHGYNSEKSLEENIGTATSIFNSCNIAGFVTSNTQGGVFDTIPYDSAGECDHYAIVQRGTIEGTGDFDCDNFCGMVNHIHTSFCYATTCGKTEHKHTSSCMYSNCKHRCEDVEACQEHDDDGNLIYVCKHSHTKACECTIPEHTHTPIPTVGYNDNAVGCYKPIMCGKPYHEHKDWVPPEDRSTKEGEDTWQHIGCWKDAYICLGHCGGHITPEIDVSITMTYEDIIEMDHFKTPWFLTDSSFPSDISDKDKESIKAWKNWWNGKISNWFIPLPDSPSEFFGTWARNFVSFGAKAIDAVTGFVGTIIKVVSGDTSAIGDFMEKAVSSLTEDEAIEAAKNNEDVDIFGFDGWFLEDGKTIDPEFIAALEELYGDYDPATTYGAGYEAGYEAWKEFDVIFPTSGTMPLVESQIEDVMKELDDAYSLSSYENREKFVREVLNSVGAFWYDNAHGGGAYASSGRNDMTGFVTGILGRSTGNYYSGWSLADFAQNGNTYTDISALKPGDILIGSTDSTLKENPAMIYLGYLPNGIPEHKENRGEGHYVVWLSEESLGAKVFTLSQEQILQFPYVYRKF